MINSNDDEENITTLDARYLAKTTYHDREYQTYSLRHEINLSPVDEVSLHDPTGSITPRPNIH